MQLTKKQEKMLSGEEGKGVQKAMEIIVGLGDIYNAKKLIPINSAHLSGASLTTSGEAGLNFLKKMTNSSAKTRVFTTLNPAGVDLENWKEMNAPEDYSKKQIKMIEEFEKLGVKKTCSCIPYSIGNKPDYKDHIAWSESSAVVFANSVLGARTNREGAPSALASAITGLTPYHGYHLKKNRKGTIIIEPDLNLLEGDSTFEYSTLGYWIGEKFPNSVPVIKGIKPNSEQLKALGAGLATSGAIALFHIPDNTIEAKKDPNLVKNIKKKAFYEEEDRQKIIEELDQVQEADLIWLGCPHSSIEELEKIIKKSTKKEKIWVCIPRKFREELESKNLLEKMREKNIKPVFDTCMVVTPLSEMGVESIGINSAKAAHYTPSLAGAKIHFAPLEELIK